jgi:hypothetical protein
MACAIEHCADQIQAVARPAIKQAAAAKAHNDLLFVKPAKKRQTAASTKSKVDSIGIAIHIHQQHRNQDTHKT